MSGRILILGGAGRLGRAAAEAFRDAGWRVASLVRGRAAGRVAPGTEIVEVDARDRESVADAAQGADVVLHALNQPYAEWRTGASVLLESAIAAARRAGATLIFPGNVYGYGAAMPPLLDEAAPMQPTSRKGAIRVAIEQRLQDEAKAGLRVVVLRAGDFFGGAPGSWLDRVIINRLGKGRVVYPGPLDVEHAWAYLPDVAAALVALAETRGTLPPFAEFGFSGYAVSGRDLIKAIARMIDRPLKVERMPWTMLRLLSPIVPIFRELTDIAYLWRVPHRIDGTRLAATIGTIPLTPFEDAIAASLAGLGVARRP